MELVKTQICINLTLYAKKYDEDFETFQERFAGIVWTLLTTTGTDVRFDAVGKGGERGGGKREEERKRDCQSESL